DETSLDETSLDDTSLEEASLDETSLDEVAYELADDEPSDDEPGAKEVMFESGAFDDVAGSLVEEASAPTEEAHPLDDDWTDADEQAVVVDQLESDLDATHAGAEESLAFDDTTGLDEAWEEPQAADAGV